MVSERPSIPWLVERPPILLQIEQGKDEEEEPKIPHKILVQIEEETLVLPSTLEKPIDDHLAEVELEVAPPSLKSMVAEDLPLIVEASSEEAFTLFPSKGDVMGTHLCLHGIMLFNADEFDQVINDFLNCLSEDGVNHLALDDSLIKATNPASHHEGNSTISQIWVIQICNATKADLAALKEDKAILEAVNVTAPLGATNRCAILQHENPGNEIIPGAARSISHISRLTSPHRGTILGALAPLCATKFTAGPSIEGEYKRQPLSLPTFDAEFNPLGGPPDAGFSLPCIPNDGAVLMFGSIRALAPTTPTLMGATCSLIYDLDGNTFAAHHDVQPVRDDPTLHASGDTPTLDLTADGGIKDTHDADFSEDADNPLEVLRFGTITIPIIQPPVFLCLRGLYALLFSQHYMLIMIFIQFLLPAFNLTPLLCSFLLPQLMILYKLMAPS